MKYIHLLWKNIYRRKLRAIFTIVCVTAAFLLFGMLTAVNNAFTGGVDFAGVDRLMIMNKISFMQPLPLSYLGRIKQVEGVKSVTHSSWVEAYYLDSKNYMVILAVEPPSYLSVYDEITMPETEKTKWLSRRSGIAVGRALALRFDWSVGDVVTLTLKMPGLDDGAVGWRMNVDAIFDEAYVGGDTNTLLMHYDFYNESRTYDRDTTWSYAISVEEDVEPGTVAARIDREFENSSAETKTWSEKAIVKTLVAQFGNIGAIVLGVTAATFLSMLLITGSTISESVRERRSELATLKAIGYSHKATLALVLAESVLLVFVGGFLGLLLAYILNGGVSLVLQQYLPLYGMSGTDLLLGIVLIFSFGIASGYFPARSVFRMKVTQTLRAE